MTAVLPTNAPVRGGWLRMRRTAPGQLAVRVARWIITGCVERYLRIDTVSPAAGRPSAGDGGADGIFRDSCGYEPLDYPLLVLCLRALRLGPDDVLVEIGCGMGRAICIGARRPVRRCIGIELSPPLAERARLNAARLRGRRALIEIIERDAALVDYGDGTAFYLFNPFGPATLDVVLGRIRTSVEQRPRRVRIVYANPVHRDVLARADWLRFTGEVTSRWFRMRAACWVHEPPPDQLGEAPPT